MGFMTLCLHVGWSSFTGNSLAWVWGRRTVQCNQERLDRALVSHSLLKIYPNRKLSDLYASVYDRFPILLTCNSHRWVGRKRKFRFETYGYPNHIFMSSLEILGKTLWVRELVSELAFVPTILFLGVSTLVVIFT